MAKLYGKEKPDNEIVEFITNYVASLQNYEGDRFNEVMRLIDEIIKREGNDKLVLDYGCGWGHYALAIRDLGNTVEAIDLSKNEIDICEIVWGQQKDITFKCTDIKEYEDHTFDIVLSTQVIEHVHNPGNYLTQINRVLRLNGRLIITLPNSMNPRYFLPYFAGAKNEQRVKNHNKRVLDNYSKTHEHINAWDPYHFAALLASVGFSVENYTPMEGIPFPMRRPFKPYWRGWLSRLGMFRYFSYTMLFSCVKERFINIQNYE